LPIPSVEFITVPDFQQIPRDSTACLDPLNNVTLERSKRRRHAMTNGVEDRYMADQIIVATFDDTNAAYDAVTALKALKTRE